MKRLLVLLTVLLFSATVWADIGPSPSYSFEITNAGDYPDYAFFYKGVIHRDLALVEGSEGVYKFDTVITFYAVSKENPLSTQPLIREGADFEEVASQSVVSPEVHLNAGHTVYRVSSFDPEAKTMSLSVQSNAPDLIYPIEAFIFSPLVLLAPIIAVVLIVWFVKRSKK